MERRTLLAMMVHAGGAVVAGIVGIPALIMAISPVWKERRRERWQAVGAIDEFPLQRVSEAIVEVPRNDWSAALRSKLVFVWRPSDDDDEVVVYSRNCTDLSCPLILDHGSQWFMCPCHGGVFDTSGQRRAGPPSRPMFRYASRVRENMLEIDLDSLPPMT